MNPLELVYKVIPLCYRHGGSVSSWGRTFVRNIQVGGHPQSWHMLWLGIDVVLDDMIQNAAFERDADRLGLKAIFESDHYHLEPK